MTDPVTLTIARADRDDQLIARAELRAVCRAYLKIGATDRTAEQIARATLDYLDGEEKAEGGAG